MSKLQLIVLLLSFSYNCWSQNNNFTADYFSNLQFAHRGGYWDKPENVLPTFMHSFKNGATAFETDVMMTKDGVLILFHDELVNRILDTTGIKTSDLSLKEIKSIPLRDTTFGELHTNTLKELLDTFFIISETNPQILLELDFKVTGKQEEQGINNLNQLMKNYESKYGNRIYNNFFISTYYPSVLKQLKKINPKIKTAFALINNPTSQKIAAKLAILLAPRIIRRNDVTIIQPSKCMITKRFVKKWKKRGLLITTYTANSTCEKNYISPFKVAYNTDCPLNTCPPEVNSGVGKPKKWCKRCD